MLTEAEGDSGWARKGDDLETQIGIALNESLLGCSKQLKGHPGYPDGLDITIPCGTTNNEVLRITDKGMMKKDKALGTLFCRVHVTVTEKDRDILARNQPLLSAMFN